MYVEHDWFFLVECLCRWFFAYRVVGPIPPHESHGGSFFCNYKITSTCTLVLVVGMDAHPRHSGVCCVEAERSLVNLVLLSINR